MNLKKRSLAFLCCVFCVFLLLPGCRQTPPPGSYRAIAYVTVPASDNWRWIGTDADGRVESAVDVRYVTHINFAFGMLEAFRFMDGQPGRPLQQNGVALPEAYIDPADGKPHYRVILNGWIEEMNALVDGRPYLKALAALKQQKPELNILLSVGGWDSDGFCYMAKNPEGRAEFIQSCIDILHEYQIDGIDLDWEYPTNGGWGVIAHCDSCVQDARTLLLESRAAFDAEFGEGGKLLTIASGGSQPWVDEATFAALDYMNVMCYDYDPRAGGRQAGMDYVKSGMKQHIMLVGDTPENRAKVNLGVPFYNSGGPYLVPYCKPWNGTVDASPEITAQKMNWVKKEGYGGAFYWAYSMDTFPQDVADASLPEVKILQRTLYETLNGAAE